MKLYIQKADYDQEYGKKDPLFINNFGFYQDLSEDISVSRPLGRLDYQLIYVSKGELCLQGTCLKDGEYVLFTPGMPQEYTYRHPENSCYYWIHFTGNQTESLLAHPSLTPGYHNGCHRKTEADTLFSLLTKATFHSKEGNNPYSLALLHAIFQLFSAPIRQTPFSLAKAHLEDTSSHESVQRLAHLYGMTAEHFIRSFRDTYGTTPKKYQIMHQLLQAKNILADTNLSVSAVAAMCGFSDPYYFSRLFKKHMGLSPSEFKKQSANAIKS